MFQLVRHGRRCPMRWASSSPCAATADRLRAGAPCLPRYRSPREPPSRIVRRTAAQPRCGRRTCRRTDWSVRLGAATSRAPNAGGAWTRESSGDRAGTGRSAARVSANEGASSGSTTSLLAARQPHARQMSSTPTASAPQCSQVVISILLPQGIPTDTYGKRSRTPLSFSRGMNGLLGLPILAWCASIPV